MPVVNAEEWNRFIRGYPEAHLLQTAEWGALKADFGWRPVWLVSGETGAQVLFRSLPLGLSIAYLPKGPIGPDWPALWPELHQLCRQRRAVFLKVEPDAWEDQEASAGLSAAGFHPSAHSIQPRRTLVLDITGDEEDILARMKQKTRYNIRLSERKGVRVSVTEDVETFSNLMLITGERDAFGVHTLAYYQRAFQLFNPPGMCALFIADYQGQPLAGLMAFAHGKRAWYFYGASDNQYRNLMPTYLVQWEAIRWARTHGCTSYDLWGVPDQDEEALEADFQERSEGLWGVYRFKRGFGGELKRASRAWDKIYNPLAYQAYRLLFAHRGGE